MIKDNIKKHPAVQVRLQVDPDSSKISVENKCNIDLSSRIRLNRIIKNNEKSILETCACGGGYVSAEGQGSKAESLYVSALHKDNTIVMHMS